MPNRFYVLSRLAVVFFAILLYFVLLNISAVWNGMRYLLAVAAPFFYGIAFAFLLAGPTHFYERQIGKFIKLNHKASRAIGIACAAVSVLIVLAVLFYAMLPQLIESVRALYSQMPQYVERLQGYFGKIDLPWEKLAENATKMIPKVFDMSKEITSGVLSFLIGVVLSIYLLASKELFIAQLKKLMFACLPNKFVTASVRLGRYVGRTFVSYISGQILDAAILGTLCFGAMLVLRLPYALLISFMITIFNLIPFFGPVLGAIPSAFILFMIKPIYALWFVILIIVLQQIDSIFISPRVVGRSTGLSPFWVLFSVIVGGKLFGFLGIVLGVPTFSVLYVLVKGIVERKLDRKNLPSATASYNESEREI